MTNPLEIEIGDTVESSVGINKGAGGVCIDICFGGNGTYKISWDDYNASWAAFKDLTLIKKGKAMKFTKSDLKTGMFVKHRDGDYAVVLDNDLSGLEHYVSLDTITPKLISSCLTANDIMSVYVKAERCCMNSHLSGLGLRRVWERTEQTPAQKEMEVLQAKMDELQEQMKVVQAKL
jgi:hypothetical protein